MNRTMKVPKYRLHSPTNQAIVVLGGRMFYLGRYGSIESRSEYARLIAEWTAQGGVSPPQAGSAPPSGPGDDPVIAELIRDYWRHAEVYYRKNGEPTTEVGMIKLATTPLRRLYGDTPARDFGPLALKAVRQEFVKAGLCRNEINRRTRLIIRMFKWAVENEKVPPSVHHGLKAVDGLRKGRCEVRESKPVKPVPDAFIDAVLPHVSRQVAAMIQLQRLTGMRPGEVIIMRAMDINTSGAIWEFCPDSHKTEHHEKNRLVFIGPKAQEVLRPWLRPDLAAYLFSPREAMAEFAASQRAARKSKVQPSQKDRRMKRPKRAPGERYTTPSYGHAITMACDKAGVPHWSPNRLRHNAATRIRREFGLDVAKAVLGHSSVVPTQLYAEQDMEAAAAAMAKVG
jgi:integrase